MHLLLLGIQKTTMKKIKKWHSLQRSGTNFINYTSGKLDHIQKLNITWCKAMPYKSGKLGGWVSENYLAMTRLNKWFYSGIESITTDETVKELNHMINIPQERWLTKYNKAWLEIRGLDSNGCYKTLKHRVQQYMADPDNIPEIILLMSLPARNVFLTTQALTCMIAHLMITDITNESITEAEKQIKIFLNTFDEFDKEFSKECDDEESNKNCTSSQKRFHHG